MGVLYPLAFSNTREYTTEDTYMDIVFTQDIADEFEEADMDALYAFLSGFVDWEDVEYLEEDSEAPEGSEEA
jgi:hypothetical protein